MMAALEFGSAEAAKIIEANKNAESLVAMEAIDWDKVADSATVEQSGYTAGISYVFAGRNYFGTGEDSWSEERAIEHALNDLKAQIKRDIVAGKVKPALAVHP